MAASISTIATGEGPPVLLVHGWSGFKESWGPLPEVIVRAGRKAVAVDLPGTGETAAPPRYRHRPEDHAESLIGLLDELGPAAVVAHSLGVQPALLVAAGRPDLVGRLVLLAPKVIPPGRQVRRLTTAAHLLAVPFVGRRVAATALRLLRRDPDRRIASYRAAVAHPEAVADDPAARRLLRDAADRLGTADADALVAVLDEGLRFDVRAVAPLVVQPTLVVTGVRDPVIHPGQAVGLAGMLPEARLVRVEECGHLPHLERPGEVGEAVTAHLGGRAA